jgi:disulfide bond formation protein DsbB
MMNKLRSYIYPVAALQAVVAMAGSLYFSEVMHFVPCVLCWYQRITMYPLVAILLVGIYFKDSKVYRQVLPLAIIGLLIATYHVVLYYGVNWGIRPDWVGPCVAGVSCTTKYVEWFGFVTIPLLSWVAHFVITILMGLAWKAQKRVG